MGEEPEPDIYIYIYIYSFFFFFSFLYNCRVRVHTCTLVRGQTTHWMILVRLNFFLSPSPLPPRVFSLSSSSLSLFQTNWLSPDFVSLLFSYVFFQLYLVYFLYPFIGTDGGTHAPIKVKDACLLVVPLSTLGFQCFPVIPPPLPSSEGHSHVNGQQEFFSKYEMETTKCKHTISLLALSNACSRRPTNFSFPLSVLMLF